MLTRLTHNKHITNVTSTTRYHSSRGNMWWWTQNMWSGFLAAGSAVESGDFSIWEPEWTQSWLTGLWWCIWRSAALCCVCRAGSWSVPPCPLRSGPGQRWGASSWPPQTTSPTCGRTASPTQPEYPTARGSLPCWHWTVSKVDLWLDQQTPSWNQRCMLSWIGDIHMCRALIIIAIILSFFGSILVLVGMKCTKIGGTEIANARVTFAGGMNYLIGGTKKLSKSPKQRRFWR